jgi:polysaccharide biosynthesis protein PslH
MNGLSILFLTTLLPSARCSGGEIVTAHYVEALRSLGHEVQVLGYGRAGYHPAWGERLIEHRPIETRGSPVRAAFWFGRALARGRAYSVEKFVGAAYRAALSQALRERRWDVVILDHAQMAWLLPAVEGQRLIHISHNNEAALYAEQARTGHLLRRLVFARESQRMGQAESDLVRGVSSVWTLTKSQSRYFEQLGARSVAVFAIPSIALPDHFRLPEPDIDIALLGTWSWKPNRQGLDWFIDHVAPLLPVTTRLVIAGAGADDLRGRLPHLEIAGRVPDAAAFLARARLIAVPAIAGDGIQIKTLDAMAIGRPVVATSLALRGIEDIPPYVSVADDPQSFAAALSRKGGGLQGTAEANWAKQRQDRFLRTVGDSLISVFDFEKRGHIS